MSPRAAWRLEALGFGDVYDYVAGKADWGSAGLPLEGTTGPRAIGSVRDDVPTCYLADRLQDIREQPGESGWDVCVVVNAQRIVLGLLGRAALQDEREVSVEEVMTAGPSTVRPSIELKSIAARMRTQDLSVVLVTRSDGTRMGVLRREDAERAVRDNS